jgi:hypothetical protein
MKINCSVIVLVLLTGCSGLQIKHGVVDNVFYSNYPAVAVQIDDGFEYADEEIKNEFSDLGAEPVSTNIIKKRFVFINRKEKRAIVISIQTLMFGYWNMNSSVTGVNVLESDRVSKQGEIYKHSVFTFKDQETNRCMLAHYLCRTAGADNTTLLGLFYFGEIADFNKNCIKWHRHSLNKKQQRFIEKFKKDSEKNLVFINPSTVKMPE